ncbi:MAG: SPOR domain-containing protein [Candidatus Omnitrophica bacterium]|jgi:cell division septation protein DedD|nr:SPOR domain-containing protein [Candidatus Omnitrophota bacterium]
MRGEQLKLFGAGDESNSKLKRRLIVVPLDTFILSGVVVFLLFILAFSLGVEKGRKISMASDDTVEFSENALKQKMPIVAQNKTPVRQQNIAIAKPVIGGETRQIQAVKNVQITDKKIEASQGAANAKEGYYIQLASYNKESFADAEAKRLKDRGFPSFTAKKGAFIVLYAGTFKTIAEAQKNMGLLKKNYKDCVLRRL